MGNVAKQVEVPKEISDVLDFVVAVAKVVKEKGDYTKVIGELVTAIEGVGEVKNEIKDLKAIGAAAGIFIGDLLDVFVKKEA